MRPKKSKKRHPFVKSLREKNARPSPSTRLDLIQASPAKDDLVGNPLPEREIDFAKLKDGALAEVIADPADRNRTLLAIFKRGRVRFTNRVQDGDRVLVPIPRTAVGFSDVRLPRGIMRYGSVSRLFYTIANFIRYAVDLPSAYPFVVAAFVLYTWLADRLPTAVYLSIIGLSQSGKSTLLELLSLICRQPLLVSDISQAAVYQACTQFSPTLLIDEIEWHSTKNTSTLRQLLRAGTSRSSRVLRVHQSGWSFGPKAFSSLEPSSDPALNNRCIQIPMAETIKRGLLKPGDPRMVKLAGAFRRQLLRFRFNSYHSVRPAIIPGAEELRPRSRDLLSSLAAPWAPNQFVSRLLLEFFKLHQDPSTREPLAPRQDAMLAILFEIIHKSPTLPSVRVGELAKSANALFLQRGERLTVTDKGAGSMLSAMGFHAKQRTNVGWILWFDSSTRERVHQLLKTYGNSYPEAADLKRYLRICSMCRTFVAARKS